VKNTVGKREASTMERARDGSPGGEKKRETAPWLLRQLLGRRGSSRIIVKEKKFQERDQGEGKRETSQNRSLRSRGGKRG